MATSSAPVAPAVIFDFDGTLADSLEAVIVAYNRVAPMVRARPLSARDLPYLRTLGPRKALREHGIPLWKLPLVVYGVRTALRASAARIQPFAEIPRVLHELARAGHRLCIVSTNSRGNIEPFLAAHQLRLFEQVAGGASMFGKARALRRLLRQCGFDAAASYYVGDEVRDIDAARLAGLRSVAVTWGYEDRASLASARPDHLIDHPEQLLALLSATPAAR